MKVCEWPQSTVILAYMCGHDVLVTIHGWGFAIITYGGHHPHISRNVNRDSQFAELQGGASENDLPVVGIQ